MKNSHRIGFISVFGFVFAIYAWTMAPSVSFWDCGEYIATSYILGVPHPPGSPLQVLVRRIFTLLPIGSEIAFRSNLFSVLVSSLTAAFLYLCIYEIITRFKKPNTPVEKLIAHGSGIMGAVIASFSFTVWHNAVESESYAPATFLLVFSLWLALTWAKRMKRKFLLVIGYIFGLSIGFHLTPLLAAPAVLIFVLIIRPDIIKDLKFIFIIILLFLMGTTTYGYLVIRARQNPAINEASPTDFQKFWDVFTRKQYGPMKLLPRQTQLETEMGVIPAFAEQLKMYFKYLSWQWTPYPREEAMGQTISPQTRLYSRAFTTLFLFLAFFGMFSCYKLNRKVFLLFFITLFFASVGLVGYMNFKFSPSDPNPQHQPREVRERHYFFGPSFVLFGFFIGMAVYGCFETLSRFRLVAYLIFPLTLVPIIGNYHSHANRRGNYIADDFGYNMLSSCDDNSILFTNGDNDTFPLWFAQEVKKVKPTVVVCNFSLLNTPWYMKQMKAKGVPMSLTDFQIENLIAYPVIKDDKPLRETLLMKDIALRDIIATNTGKSFKPGLLLPLKRSTLPKDYRDMFTEELIHPSIYTKLLPRNYWMRLPSEYLLPHREFADLVMKDYKGKMNIYFAVTCSRDNTKGFEPYLRMEALAKRLLPNRGEEFDIQKSDSLLNKVFRYRSIFDPSVYKDTNARRLISNYASAYFYLGLAYKQKGILDRAIEAFEIANKLQPGQLVPVEYWLTDLYTQKGDYAKAESLLLKSISNSPSAPLWYLLGKIYMAQAKKEKAETAFKEATKLNKSEPSGYAGLLQLYETLGDSQKIGEILNSIPEKSQFVSRLFYLLKNEKREDLAQLVLERWVATHPYDTSALKLLKD